MTSLPSEYRQAFDEMGLYVPDMVGDRVAANEKIRWQAVFFMGPAGAGKSFVRGKRYMKHVGFKLIDPDEIKKTHPEYDPEEPFKVHEWSKQVSESAFKDAVTSGRGDAVILDGTGRDASAIKSKIILAEKNGYHTFLVYVTVPLEISLFRNRNRARHVPEKVLMSAYEKIKKSFTALKGLVDKFKVIMNYDSQELKVAIPDIEMYPPPQPSRPPRHESFPLEVDPDPNYGKEKNTKAASDLSELLKMAGALNKSKKIVGASNKPKKIATVKYSLESTESDGRDLWGFGNAHLFVVDDFMGGADNGDLFLSWKVKWDVASSRVEQGNMVRVGNIFKKVDIVDILRKMSRWAHSFTKGGGYLGDTDQDVLKWKNVLSGGTSSLGNLLKDVREQMTESQAHSRSPFPHLSNTNHRFYGFRP